MLLSPSTLLRQEEHEVSERGQKVPCPGAVDARPQSTWQSHSPKDHMGGSLQSLAQLGLSHTTSTWWWCETGRAVWHIDLPGPVAMVGGSPFWQGAPSRRRCMGASTGGRSCAQHVLQVCRHAGLCETALSDCPPSAVQDTLQQDGSERLRASC